MSHNERKVTPAAVKAMAAVVKRRLRNAAREEPAVTPAR
jgi:hypothetical protein